MSRKSRDLAFYVLAAAALGSAANAGWMLLAPAHWYAHLPAGVPDTGPYNEHFVRDIGSAFATLAFVFGCAAPRSRMRAPLVLVGAFFLVAHAALHVFDTLRGALDADHWWLDFGGVYLPVLVLAPLAVAALRELGAGPRPHTTRAPEGEN
jgi:hypothetical protein